MHEQIITSIWIYPVKSLGGIQLQEAKVLPKGLEHDRRWMLIDEHNNFMTQRVFPKMALFKMEMMNGDLGVRFENLSIDLPSTFMESIIPSKVWNDNVEVREVSREHSQWFSDLLGISCRLVCFPEENPRFVEKSFAFRNEQVSLADAYPLLIISESSLEDLNNKLQSPVPMNRFRPNIVFKGGKAFAEDNWNYFSIGESQFSGASTCSRCAMTTIDQDSGVKGVEPLATLSKYRKKDKSVIFGKNVLVIKPGWIRVGDRIRIDKENYY